MPRKKSEKECVTTSKERKPEAKYRFIAIRRVGDNFSVEFTTKESALSYIDELNDNRIEWYGLFEIDAKRDTLHTVLHKRLIPYDMSLPVSKKEETKKPEHAKKKRIPRKNKPYINK